MSRNLLFGLPGNVHGEILLKQKQLLLLFRYEKELGMERLIPKNPLKALTQGHLP